jgi:PKD repeat protein
MPTYHSHFPFPPFTLKALGVLSLVSLLCGSPTYAQAAVPEGYTVGTPWVGPLGVRERNTEIMEREDSERRERPEPHPHPRPRFNFPNPQNNPVSPDIASWPPLAPGEKPILPLTPQVTGVNFTGATLSDTRAYPPDSMGAAGPAQFIVAVNGRIRTFNKTTGTADGVLDADTDVFFQSVLTPPASNNFTSDPRIRYDRLSQRWFAIMIDVPNQTGTSPNRIMLAVSDGPVIAANSVWTFYYFRHDLVSPAGDSGKFADYPTLGIDANALYIGVNIFGTRGQGGFANTTAFVVRKSSLLSVNNSATNIVVTAFRGLVPAGNNPGPYTPQGVDNYDPNANEGYIIGVAGSTKFLFFGQLELRRISDPGGTPAISPNIDITVPLNSSPIEVQHLGNTNGTANNLDGLDYRLLAAHIRNGRLWTSENMGVDNNGTRNTTATRNAVRWYELQGIASGQTPALVQSGTVFQPSASNTTDQRSYWMGTVMVSGQGHAAMGFSVGGANEYINAGTVGRLVNDPLGTMRTPALYTASSTAYNPRDHLGDPVNRWGDYSYTCLDPNDDMTMWTIQEYCQAVNSYAVQVVKLLAPPPAHPTNCNPAALSAGTNNVNLVISASSDGENGFFDPGAGFSNRLSAAVNGGGVTINTITYTDPAHITLNVSVAGGATAGGRTISVTNPDGQSATSSSALLTILGGTTNNPPLASFVGAPTTGGAPLNVFFTNQSTFAGTYTWNFGDAGTSTATNASHSFTNAGLYTVTLDATGPGGSSSFTRTNYIVVTNVPVPVAGFTAAPQNGYAPLTVYFTNLSTFATNYSWLFGDGGASTSFSPLNTYSNAGQYTIKLLAAGPGGTNFLVRTNYVSVSNVPPALIESISLSNDIVSITWSSITGKTYRVQRNEDLSGNNWSNLPPDVPAPGASTTRDYPAGSATQSFYRVQFVP